MKIDIIQIGNSQGIRIPKAIIEQCGLKGTVTVEVEDKKIIISATKKARSGWEESFKLMAQAGDDKLLEPEIFSLSSDEKDWKW